MTYEIRKNHQFNSAEIYFDGKLSEEVRNALKALKFRWHSVKKSFTHCIEYDVFESSKGRCGQLHYPKGGESQ